MVGVLYVACFASWRCITGAYAPGGQFGSDSAAPMFGSRFSAIRILPFLSLLHGNYQGSHPTRIFICMPRETILDPLTRHARNVLTRHARNTATVSSRAKRMRTRSLLYTTRASKRLAYNTSVSCVPGTLDPCEIDNFSCLPSARSTPRHVLISSRACPTRAVHYDAPRFYAACSLYARPMERFQFLSYASFSIASLLAVVVLTAGYLTFGV